MANESYVLRNYRKVSPTKKKAIGDDLIKGFGENTGIFNNLPMSVADFLFINETYNNKIKAAHSKDKNKIKERNDYFEEVWLLAVDEYADYVESVAKGNYSVINLAGFKSTKNIKVKKEKPGQMMLGAKAGKSGSESIYYRSTTQTDAKGFLAIILKSGAAKIKTEGNKVTIIFNNKDGSVNEVMLAISTRKKGMVEGLMRSDLLDIQMIAFNAEGCSPLSNKATVTVP